MLLTVYTYDAFDPEALRAGSGGADAEVVARVQAILDEVRHGGDIALAELTARFDGHDPGPDGLEITRAERDRRVAEVSDDIRDVLAAAAARIRRFHEPQRRAGYTIADAGGSTLAQRIVPLDRVGVYVPGGTAAYPSSVLMNAIPARVAGVREVIMVTPTPQGAVDPVVLAAADEAGVDRIFRLGGAQAVAALAFGTARVPRVDKIVGPGNIWVATAKRLVFGEVDIDSIAGPSEVLVVADDSAHPALVAADLLAQAEHDVLATAGLVTTSPTLIAAVEAELAAQLVDLPRRAIAEQALRDHGYAVTAPDLAAALAIANKVAPEHLELMVREPRRAAAAIRHAGAIFLGPWTPEAVGDYMAGPNHVLPTAGTARFFSGLGVSDFEKRINVIELTAPGLATLADTTVRFARLERLEAHARSVSARQALAGEAADAD